MKLLEKITKQKYSIPVLNCVKVQHGQALATDMDVWIHAATDLPEGLYHGKGFSKSPMICKAHELDEFPDLMPIPDLAKADQFVVNAEKFAWVAKAMSKEETRYYLNGVFFKTSGIAGLYATDGTQGRRVTMEMSAFIQNAKEDGYNEGYIIPRGVVDLMVDAAKECKVQEFTVYLGESRAFATIGKYKFSTKYVDSTFPDMERVIVAPAFYDHPIWDCEKTAKMLERAIFCFKVAGQKHPYFAIQEDGRARIYIPSVDVEEIYDIGFKGMPKKYVQVGFQCAPLLDVRKGSKVVAWPENKGINFTPMRIDEGDTTLVIMPRKSV